MAIALLTDFGTKDYFVGAMKGVILGICGDIPIVDITHQIPPYDILAASFILESCYRDFPEGTIFAVVVDPGVGSERKGIAVSAGGRLFVAPDNGVLSRVIANESDVESYELVSTGFFREPVSRTFHGRDVFAPVAAHIFNGTKLSELGPRYDSPIMLGPSEAVEGSDGIEGKVVNIDSFGNIVTNIRPLARPVTSVELCGSVVGLGVDTFSAAKPEELIFVTGSAGFIEICLNLGNASESIGARIGDAVVARF